MRSPALRKLLDEANAARSAAMEARKAANNAMDAAYRAMKRELCASGRDMGAVLGYSHQNIANIAKRAGA